MKIDDPLYKQDGFTLDEIIDLVKGQLLVDEDMKPSPNAVDYNAGVYAVMQHFHDFKNTELALEIETGLTVYTGPLTAEMCRGDNEAQDKCKEV